MHYKLKSNVASSCMARYFTVSLTKQYFKANICNHNCNERYYVKSKNAKEAEKRKTVISFVA